MFSRTRILGLLLVSVLGVGCIGKVGEEPPPQAAQDFGGTQCMDAALPVVTKFMEGNARNEEVSAAWDCVSSVVDKFAKYVSTGNSDRYSSQDLATFIEKNFLDPEEYSRISPALQLEFMKVKQIFVGGSREYVTKAELKRSQEVFAAFKSVSLKLNPYMKVFVQSWETSGGGDLQKDMKFFEDGNLSAQEAAKELASLISKNHQAYVLSDFEKLMSELSAFYGENWESVRQIKRFMPVIKKVKKAISGGDENTISSSEWKSFVLLGMRGYVQYLRYIYFIEDTEDNGAGLKLAYIARSFEDILSVFQDLVTEKPSGSVSKDEIADLLLTFAREWPELKVSPELVSEIMKLKQAMFGGSADSWTSNDFESAKLKVFRLKAIFERFLPYYSVYGFDWDPSIYSEEASQAFFLDAQYNLEASAQELGLLFEGDYKVEDLGKLITEVERLYPGEDGLPNVSEDIKKYNPLIIRVKNVVFSENDSTFHKENWNPTLRLASRVYSDYLYWNYFVKDRTVQTKEGMASFNFFAQQSLNIARDVLATKKGGMIHKTELSALLMDMREAEILPEAITKASVDSFVDFLVNRLLVSPENRFKGRLVNSLTMESIEYLRSEFNIWAETEFFANDLYSKGKDFDLKQLQAAMKSFSEMDFREAKVAGAEMWRVFNTNTGLNILDSKLLISNKVDFKGTRESFQSLNLYRAIVRLLNASVINEKARIDNYAGLAQPEAEAAFKALRGFFVELEMLDPASLKFASSRLQEGNIFVPRADGNTLLSFEEGVDLVAMLFSGVKNGNGFQSALERQCHNGVVLKVNDRLPLSCVRKVMYEEMPKVLTRLPEYQAYMKRASKADWDYYFWNVVKAAGYIPNEKSLIRYGDVELISHIIQYLEMIYARFDKNKDGIISTPDALRAFPSFRGLILELAQEDIRSGTISAAELDDVFTFILRYGRPPTTIGEKLKYVLSWKGKPQNWDVWADRGQLAQILGYIADQVAKTSAIDPEAPPMPTQYPQAGVQ